MPDNETTLETTEITIPTLQEFRESVYRFDLQADNELMEFQINNFFDSSMNVGSMAMFSLIQELTAAGYEDDAARLQLLNDNMQLFNDLSQHYSWQNPEALQIRLQNAFEAPLEDIEAMLNSDLETILAEHGSDDPMEAEAFRLRLGMAISLAANNPELVGFTVDPAHLNDLYTALDLTAEPVDNAYDDMELHDYYPVPSEEAGIEPIEPTASPLEAFSFLATDPFTEEFMNFARSTYDVPERALDAYAFLQVDPRENADFLAFAEAAYNAEHGENAWETRNANILAGLEERAAQAGHIGRIAQEQLDNFDPQADLVSYAFNNNIMTQDPAFMTAAEADYNAIHGEGAWAAHVEARREELRIAAETRGLLDFGVDNDLAAYENFDPDAELVAWAMEEGNIRTPLELYEQGIDNLYQNEEFLAATEAEYNLIREHNGGLSWDEEIQARIDTLRSELESLQNGGSVAHYGGPGPSQAELTERRIATLESQIAELEENGDPRGLAEWGYNRMQEQASAMDWSQVGVLGLNPDVFRGLDSTTPLSDDMMYDTSTEFGRSWMDASEMLYNAEHGEGAWARRVAQQGWDEAEAAQELAEYGEGAVSWFENNLTSAAHTLLAESPDYQIALLYLQNMNAYTESGWDDFGSALWRGALDPTLWAAGAGAAASGGTSVGARIAGQVAIRRTIQSVITRQATQRIIRSTVLGALAGSVEGAATEVALEAIEQELQIEQGLIEEFDFGAMMQRGAFGAVFGAGLGGALGGGGRAIYQGFARRVNFGEMASNLRASGNASEAMQNFTRLLEEAEAAAAPLRDGAEPSAEQIQAFQDATQAILEFKAEDIPVSELQPIINEYGELLGHLETVADEVNARGPEVSVDPPAAVTAPETAVDPAPESVIDPEDAPARVEPDALDAPDGPELVAPVVEPAPAPLAVVAETVGPEAPVAPAIPPSAGAYTPWLGDERIAAAPFNEGTYGRPAAPAADPAAAIDPTPAPRPEPAPVEATPEARAALGDLIGRVGQRLREFGADESGAVNLNFLGWFRRNRDTGPVGPDAGDADGALGFNADPAARAPEVDPAPVDPAPEGRVDPDPEPAPVDPAPEGRVDPDPEPAPAPAAAIAPEDFSPAAKRRIREIRADVENTLAGYHDLSTRGQLDAREALDQRFAELRTRFANGRGLTDVEADFLMDFLISERQRFDTAIDGGVAPAARPAVAPAAAAEPAPGPARARPHPEAEPETRVEEPEAGPRRPEPEAEEAPAPEGGPEGAGRAPEPEAAPSGFATRIDRVRNWLRAHTPFTNVEYGKERTFNQFHRNISRAYNDAFDQMREHLKNFDPAEPNAQANWNTARDSILTELNSRLGLIQRSLGDMQSNNLISPDTNMILGDAHNTGYIGQTNFRGFQDAIAYLRRFSDLNNIPEDLQSPASALNFINGSLDRIRAQRPGSGQELSPPSFLDWLVQSRNTPLTVGQSRIQISPLRRNMFRFMMQYGQPATDRPSFFQVRKDNTEKLGGNLEGLFDVTRSEFEAWSAGKKAADVVFPMIRADAFPQVLAHMERAQAIFYNKLSEHGYTGLPKFDDFIKELNERAAQVTHEGQSLADTEYWHDIISALQAQNQVFSEVQSAPSTKFIDNIMHPVTDAHRKQRRMSVLTRTAEDAALLHQNDPVTIDLRGFIEGWVGRTWQLASNIYVGRVIDEDATATARIGNRKGYGLTFTSPSMHIPFTQRNIPIIGQPWFQQPLRAVLNWHGAWVPDVATRYLKVRVVPSNRYSPLNFPRRVLNLFNSGGGRKILGTSVLGGVAYTNYIALKALLTGEEQEGGIIPEAMSTLRNIGRTFNPYYQGIELTADVSEWFAGDNNWYAWTARGVEKLPYRISDLPLYFSGAEDTLFSSSLWSEGLTSTAFTAIPEPEGLPEGVSEARYNQALAYLRQQIEANEMAYPLSGERVWGTSASDFRTLVEEKTAQLAAASDGFIINGSSDFTVFWEQAVLLETARLRQETITARLNEVITEQLPNVDPTTLEFYEEALATLLADPNVNEELVGNDDALYNRFEEVREEIRVETARVTTEIAERRLAALRGFAEHEFDLTTITIAGTPPREVNIDDPAVTIELLETALRAQPNGATAIRAADTLSRAVDDNGVFVHTPEVLRGNSLAMQDLRGAALSTEAPAAAAAPAGEGDPAAAPAGEGDPAVAPAGEGDPAATPAEPVSGGDIATGIWNWATDEDLDGTGAPMAHLSGLGETWDAATDWHRHLTSTERGRTTMSWVWGTVGALAAVNFMKELPVFGPIFKLPVVGGLLAFGLALSLTSKVANAVMSGRFPESLTPGAGESEREEGEGGAGEGEAQGGGAHIQQGIAYSVRTQAHDGGMPQIITIIEDFDGDGVEDALNLFDTDRDGIYAAQLVNPDGTTSFVAPEILSRDAVSGAFTFTPNALRSAGNVAEGQEIRVEAVDNDNDGTPESFVLHIGGETYNLDHALEEDLSTERLTTLEQDPI